MKLGRLLTSYSLADFRSNKVMCPYFMARSLLDDADVVVFNYQVCLLFLYYEVCIGSIYQSHHSSTHK